MALISVVAPIFNEEQNVIEFTNRTIKALEKITRDFRIIFVDDGSEDNSWEIIQKFCSSDSRLSAMKLSKNFGHHYAITAGLNRVNSDWAIVMDTDLQDRPEVIPELYQKAMTGYDIVFVNRINRKDSFFYKVLQKFFYFILRISSGVKFDSRQANFSIINQKVVLAFNEFPEQARFYGSTVLWLGFRRTSIDAEHGSRYKGSPSYNLHKRFILASDIILAFSLRPLKFIIYVGLLTSVTALFLAFYFLVKAIFASQILVGLPILIITFFLFGGIQISSLGMIAIYLSKVFQEVKKRPLYIISESINL